MPTRRDIVTHAAAMAAIASAMATGMPIAARLAAEPQPDASGAVDDATLQLLQAVAEALAGIHPLQGHYQAYYEYRARHDAHCRLLYDRFAHAVSDRTGKAGYTDFASCDLAARFGILESIRSDPDIGRDFEIPVFQETLAVFENTDAWLLLGYDSWEGMARGLDAYRKPIATGPGHS